MPVAERVAYFQGRRRTPDQKHAAIQQEKIAKRHPAMEEINNNRGHAAVGYTRRL